MERQETQNVIKSFAQSAEDGNEIGMVFKYNGRLRRMFDNQGSRMKIQDACYELWMFNIDGNPEAKRPSNLEEAKTKRCGHPVLSVWTMAPQAALCGMGVVGGKDFHLRAPQWHYWQQCLYGVERKREILSRDLV